MQYEVIYFENNEGKINKTLIATDRIEHYIEEFERDFDVEVLEVNKRPSNGN